MAMAHERLRAARAALEVDLPSSSASLAYYALLYAARAALSEEEQNAKTHAGTWQLFGQTFVDSGRFDRELFAAARYAQRLREATDYDAHQVSADEARTAVDAAERFLDAVAALFGR
jgi:uncharacterized protein (UPF0332 family)